MRRKRNYKRDFQPDFKYSSVALTRFTNYLMKNGEKAVAQKVIGDTFDLISKQTKEDPLFVFDKALANVAPMVEVISTRVGGANYQVPHEVREDRKFVLAARWIIGAARSKKGTAMAKKLAEELVAASKNEGEAMKRKQNVHRMAEANRAFAHFARR